MEITLERKKEKPSFTTPSKSILDTFQKEPKLYIWNYENPKKYALLQMLNYDNLNKVK